MVIERQTKQDLREEVERLRARVAELEDGPSHAICTAAMDAAPFGVSISAQGGPIRWVNQALADMLGRPKEQIVGTALFDYWYHGYSESEMDKLSLLWTGELETYRYERLLQRADGRPFWGDVRTSIISDPLTDERWMLRVVEDASERQRSEEEIRSQREHSHAVLESISEGVCVFRGRQRLFVNRAFVELMGHADEADALEGQSLDFLPEEDKRRVERNEALETSRRLKESSIRRADGSEIYCVVSIARTVFDGLPASIAVLRDATLRLRARQELEASERRYRSLFEAAPMGITIVDETAKILDCNAAFSMMAGEPVEAIKGRNLREFTALPPGRTSGRSFERLAAGEIDRFDNERLWNPSANGIKWIEFRNSAVRRPDGAFEYAMSMMRDITERKRTEQQRQELYWRLAESKEEQSRDLAKELHDEIGQQLTGLRFQLERGTPGAIESALEITSELMDKVRSLSLDLRPPSLDDLGLVPALQSLLARFTERTGVRVTFKHDPDDFRLRPEVGIAAFRIIQEALTNVARHAGVDQASVRLTIDGERLIACIEDRGCGTQRQLGSSPTDSESTGLSGMYERALALSGDLRFVSAPGKGTMVEAVIPLAPSMHIAEATAG